MPRPAAAPSSTLIPFARVAEDKALRILEGFVRGEPIASIAAATGVSERNCRTIILALRHRLLRPRFNRWTVFYSGMLTIDLDQYADMVARIHGHYAKCYFNRGCFSNFRQGLRQTRVCRACPIERLDFLDPDERDAARAQIDLIQDFYELLGIRGETNLPPLTVFLLRYCHTLAIGEAFEASRRAPDDMADMKDKGERSAWSLLQALIKDLKAEPLDRADPPLSSFDAEHGDLKWLDG